MFGVLKALRHIVGQPLNQGRRVAAVVRYVRWQVVGRLAWGPVVVPFVNDTRLLALPGVPTANANVYSGLADFAEMSFVLHTLRADELFVDVGANIGSYTVVALAIGARVVAAEPAPDTFAQLMDNVRLNGAENRVEALNVAIGREEGSASFSVVRTNALSHMRAPEESSSGESTTIDVPVRALDVVLGDAEPVVIKIDVEGFEAMVVAGGLRTLARPSLLGVIMETNRMSRRYGFDEEALHRQMLDLGFTPHDYDPLERRLHAFEDPNARTDHNTLYLRDLDALAERLRTAPAFSVLGRAI